MDLFVPRSNSIGVSFPFQELIAPRVAAISQNLEKDLHYFQSTMFTVFLPGAKVLDKFIIIISLTFMMRSDLIHRHVHVVFLLDSVS